MGIAPGPASQDAVIKRTYASPGLQWRGLTGEQGETKSKGNAPCILYSVLVYIKNALNVGMIPVVYIHNNNNRNECC